jgi:hypothetical protein
MGESMTEVHCMHLRKVHSKAHLKNFARKTFEREGEITKSNNRYDYNQSPLYTYREIS